MEYPYNGRMRVTDRRKIAELIRAVATQDGVNTGVAKARLSGEASYSVSLLERMMRGDQTSEINQLRTVEAAKARGLNFSVDDLFPSSASDGEAS